MWKDISQERFGQGGAAVVVDAGSVTFTNLEINALYCISGW